MIIPTPDPLQTERLLSTRTIGTITTVAGTGSSLEGHGPIGYNGDNVNATAANIYFPQDVAPDKLGNIYIADSNNKRIQKWDVGASLGITVAGPGVTGNTSTTMSYPKGVFLDGNGNIYVSDMSNNRIQKFHIADTISTVAPSELCINNSLGIRLNVNGFFNSGNVFQVHLSDSSGNFPRNPNVIGISNNSPITVNIPSTSSSGTNYKIKIVSSNPLINGVSSRGFLIKNIESINSGVWNNKGTWSCGRSPTSLDNIRIINGNVITLPNTSTYLVKSIYNSGNISLSNNSVLKIGF